MKNYFIFGCIWFWGFIAQAGGAGKEVIVQLPEKATVTGPQISLGEIAEIVADDKAKADRVRRLNIRAAALAGEKVEISLGFIKIALRKEGYSLEDFVFQGGESIEVLTQSQSFDPADLLPRVKVFVLGQIKERPEDVDVKMEGIPKKIQLPAGKVTANFRPSFSGKYEGSVFLTAELEVDGRLIRVLPLRVTIDVYHPAVTVTKAVGKGEKFSKENVTLIRTPSSKLTGGCFSQLDSVLGRTASMSLGPGTVIRVNNIYDPPVVRHGEVVEGIVEKGNIELTVEVRVVEDGKAGDLIHVENTDSKKVLRAKVLDEKKVLIEPEVEK